MSQSLDIIRHILDENLIDAKKATEGYLNDILSGAIKEQYKEVAPSLVEDKGAMAAGKGANMSAAVAAPGAAPQTAAMQGGELFTNQSDATAYVRANLLNPDGTLNTTMESAIAQAFEAGVIAPGADGATIGWFLNALSNVPTEGPGGDGGDGDPLDPPVVYEPPREGDSQFGGSVGGFRGT